MTAAKCPSGCGRTQPAGKFLCSRCWAEVPQELQSDVYRTWRLWRRDFGDIERMRAYRAARDAALAAIA